MTVLVILSIPADTDKFREYAAAHPDEMIAIAENGRAAGALHHRFALGDGEVVVLDEWDSAESFNGFFAENEEAIGEIMQGAGASGPPQTVFYESIETADAF
jgi:heme-degrading monooxygenase HmoA